MNTKYTIITFLLLFLSSFSWAQDQVFCDQESFDSRNGEELIYKIYYKIGFVWIPAGEVTFTSKDSDNYYEFVAKGKTYRSYDPFFKVRDEFYSKVDKSTLKPIEFKRKIHEGKYKKYYETVFDYDQNLALSKHGKSENKLTNKQCSIEDYCIQDILSVLFHLRNMNMDTFKKGDSLDLNIFLDNEIFDVNLTYGGTKRSKYIRNLGYYDVHLLIPETIAGNVFDEENKMNIWVSNDINKVPLMIESPVSVGSIKAVLKSHKGLKSLN